MYFKLLDVKYCYQNISYRLIHYSTIESRRRMDVKFNTSLFFFELYIVYTQYVISPVYIWIRELNREILSSYIIYYRVFITAVINPISNIEKYW